MKITIIDDHGVKRVEMEIHPSHVHGQEREDVCCKVLGEMRPEDWERMMGEIMKRLPCPKHRDDGEEHHGETTH